MAGTSPWSARCRDLDLDQLIWKLPEMISCLSDDFELMPGDVIMMGTPCGVGAVSREDVMEGRFEGVGA